MSKNDTDMRFLSSSCHSALKRLTRSCFHPAYKVHQLIQHMFFALERITSVSSLGAKLGCRGGTNRCSERDFTLALLLEER